MIDYKSKIIRFKMDENPLQHRIYFLTFVESLEMIFPQYQETCEVIIYYSRIGGNNIEDYTKKAIRNLLYENIDIHSIILISEFQTNGKKCIRKLKSHCSKMTFADKSRYDRNFEQITYKGGESKIIYIKGFQNAHALSVSVGNSYFEDHLMHTFLDNFHQGGQ